eukprot:c9561_g1_i2.p1 GENE.c9561_g1_i2~~c9561_g1_i2.p1  ORF type:complete len:592 (+),score=119.24 c9561_g1_i2:235-1776(+)
MTDQWHLKLQALQYQIHHYQTNIAQCRDSKSSEGDVPMISISDFIRECPDFTAVPSDPNYESKLMHARLKLELTQRKRLVQEVAELKSRKQLLMESLEKRQQSLEDVVKNLRALPDVLLGVESAAESHTIAKQNLSEKAAHLPAPLFPIFCQLTHFIEAKETDQLLIEIDGNVNDVQRDDDAEQDAKADSDEDQEQPSRKRRRVQSVRHPLSVRLTLRCDDARQTGEAKSISLCFLCYACRGVIENVDAVVGVIADSDSQQELLHDLYGPDPFVSTLPPRIQAWYPYAWAQLMGCVVRVPNAAAISVEDLIGRLKMRIGAKPMLKTQIDYLNKLTIPIPSPSPNFPLPPQTQLTAFAETSSEDDVAGQTVRRFRALFQNDQTLKPSDPPVTVQALVEVSVEYPLTAPLFEISFVSHPVPDMTQHRNQILSIMREVNGYSIHSMPKQDANMLLSCQMRKLQMLIDIYVRTEIKADAEVGSRLSLRNSVGRDRQKPAVFNKRTRMFEARGLHTEE